MVFSNRFTLELLSHIMAQSHCDSYTKLIGSTEQMLPGLSFQLNQRTPEKRTYEKFRYADSHNASKKTRIWKYTQKRQDTLVSMSLLAVANPETVSEGCIPKVQQVANNTEELHKSLFGL